MESEKSKELFKINLKVKPKHVIIQPTGVIRGLFRGLLMGMIFGAVIGYIKFVDVNSNKNFGGFTDVTKNDTSIKPHENTQQFLYRKERILCFVVPITEQTLKERGHMFLATWAKRCHKFIFFADENYDELKDYVVKVEDKRDKWTRMREALAHIYKHYMEDFDWILRATDSSYVVMENLRWLLYQYDADYPIVFGQRYLKEDYIKGIYALSKTGFIKLIENAFTNAEICEESGYDEDKELSKCLQHINVLQVDGIDTEGRGMFFHSRPDALLFPVREDKDFDKWYFHKLAQSMSNCCSDRLISIQNVRNTQLYYMEYFIYKVHAFGRHRMFEELPHKFSAEEILKN